jgi:hypothetical protein
VVGEVSRGQEFDIAPGSAEIHPCRVWLVGSIHQLYR